MVTLHLPCSGCGRLGIRNLNFEMDDSILLLIINCQFCHQPMLVVAPPLSGDEERIPIKVLGLDSDKMSPNQPLQDRAEYLFQIMASSFGLIFGPEAKLADSSSVRLREVVMTLIQTYDSITPRPRPGLFSPSAEDIARNRLN